MKQRAKDGGHFSPKRSFFPSSEDALCIFDLRILVLQLVMDAGGALNMHFRLRHRVTFVVHRRALVDLVEVYAQAEEAESQTVDTTQASPSTGDILPGPLPAGAIADGVWEEGEDEFGPDVENSRSRNIVSWSQWGPAVTRWFNSDNVSTHWITTTAGQRCVRMASDPPPEGYHFVVLDFNPVNVKKMQLWLKEKREVGENETEGEWEWEEAVPEIGKDTQNTIPYLVPEGEEDIDHEDSTEVVVDPTLRMWIFDFTLCWHRTNLFQNLRRKAILISCLSCWPIPVQRVILLDLQWYSMKWKTN